MNATICTIESAEQRTTPPRPSRVEPTTFGPRNLLLPALLALCTALVLRPVVARAIDIWSVEEEFSYGFLVLPIAAGLIWLRRHDVLRSLGPGATAGLPIAIGALALYLIGTAIRIEAIAGLAISPLLFGGIAYLWGWRTARVLAFPIGFLAFGLAVYRGALNSVGFAMQGSTAFSASALGQLLGLAVQREGLVLRGDHWAFLVADACSGMNSLLALLALASLWVYLTRGPALGKAMVVLSVLPLVLIANTIRVTLVLLVAEWFGQDAATGLFHGASSLVLFGVSFGGMLLVSWMVRCRALRAA